MKYIGIFVFMFLLTACNIRKEKVERESVNRNENLNEIMKQEEYFDITNEELIGNIIRRIEKRLYEADGEIINEKTMLYVEGTTRLLIDMPQERAVYILVELEKQYTIIILEKADEISQIDGTTSIVPIWLSLMDRTKLLQLAEL